MPGKLRVRERAQPFLDERVTTLRDVVHDRGPEQLAEKRTVVGPDSVADRLVGVPPRQVPRTRPSMQRRYQLTLASAELRLQRVTDEPVPAIPLMSRIDGSQQRTRALHLSQHDIGASAA